VSISSNGYVCLGENTECGGYVRPTPYDIIVGLNYYLDPTKKESVQIFYQNLSINSSEFISAKQILKKFDSEFQPNNIFMVTYDNVLSFYISSSGISFQVFFITNFKKSLIIMNYKSCPTNLNLYGSSGLTHIDNDGKWQEYIIENNQQCTGSNIDMQGVWVSEVTNILTGNYFNFWPDLHLNLYQSLINLAKLYKIILLLKSLKFLIYFYLSPTKYILWHKIILFCRWI
jgi:hypothetical protein